MMTEVLRKIVYLYGFLFLFSLGFNQFFLEEVSVLSTPADIILGVFVQKPLFF